MRPRENIIVVFVLLLQNTWARKASKLGSDSGSAISGSDEGGSTGPDGDDDTRLTAVPIVIGFVILSKYFSIYSL